MNEIIERQKALIEGKLFSFFNAEILDLRRQSYERNKS
jgi:hypothetical protein